MEFHLRRLLEQSREPSVELLVDAIAKNEGKAMHMLEDNSAASPSDESEWVACKLDDIVLVWCQSLFREQDVTASTPNKIVWLALVESIVSSNALRIVRLERVGHSFLTLMFLSFN